jgi:hypothetical protein
LLHHLHFLHLARNALVVLESVIIHLLPQFLLDLPPQDVRLRGKGFGLSTRPYLYYLFTYYVADLLATTVLMGHCDLELEFLLNCVCLINAELEGKGLVD